MKRRIIAILLAAALLTTGVTAAGTGTGSAVYKNASELADGFTYINELSYTSAGRRVETHTLETAPGSSVYPIALACDTVFGGFTMSNMIKYAESQGYNVVGAINGDFGYWETRIPCGMVVENGVYKSSPEGNNAIGFTDGEALVSFAPMVNITLTNDETGEFVTTEHLNKSRADGGLYLYSEYFSTVSNRTTGDGWAVRFKVLDDEDYDNELSLSGEVRLEVVGVYEGHSALTIGEDNILLTATTASGLGAEFEKFAVGDIVTLSTTCSDESLAEAEWIAGCGNIIVSEGEIFGEQWWDSSVTGTNPRTAVGIKADGTLVYHVMDGRTTASRGATLRELAEDMISMGCIYAVNMDGGGSSIMSLLLPGDNGLSIVNDPSDGSPRSVGSYILLVTDETPNGRADRLFLKEDGAYVLAGSSLDLHATATDRSMASVAPPSDINYGAELGSVKDGVYTAGTATGVDTVRLLSDSTGTSGKASIHVISAADTLTVLNAETNRTISSAELENEEELKLAAKIQYNMRDVAMNADAVTYSVEGDIGSVSEEGVFTASGAGGAEGKIIVSAAGLKQEIKIRITLEFSDMVGHWANDYVKELYRQGVVNGTTATTFSPDANMKRGDFVLMLYRAAGEPEFEPTADLFADVPGDAYYARAIAWAGTMGIAKGTGDGNFMPESTLTRQEGFTFVYRAMAALGVTPIEGELSAIEAFTDAADLADWAQQPAATLISMGIVEGSDGKLTPTATLTRAQMAKILCVTLYRSSTT